MVHNSRDAILIASQELFANKPTLQLVRNKKEWFNKFTTTGPAIVYYRFWFRAIEVIFLFQFK